MDFILIDEQDHSQVRLLKHLVNESRTTNHFLKEIHTLMSTVPSGLQALTTAVTDLTSAVSAAVAKISDLSSQLSALNSEDPAVQDLASQLEQQVSALNSAVNPPAPTA